MNKTNLNQIPEISNPKMETTVKNYFITQKGLIISFTHKGTAGKIIADPSQTAALLLDASYIKDYTLYKNLPIIYTETLEVTSNPVTGEPDESTDTMEETWRAFVKRFEFELDDRLALLLTKYYLQLVEAEEIRKKTKEALNMIKKLAS